MKRGFKIVSSKKDQDIHLPQRQTTRAAGYDFEASEDFVLPSIWKGNFLKALWQIHQQKKLTDEEFKAIDKEVWEQAYYAARELQKHAVRYYTLSEEEKRREQPPYKERRSSRSLIPLYYASLAKELKLSDFDIYRALVAWSCWHPELGFSTDLERPQILKDITEYRMKILGIPEYFRDVYKKVWRT